MKIKRFLITLYAVMLLFAAFPAQAFAASDNINQPPAIMIISYNAPEDLQIQVEIERNGERFLADTMRARRAWELSFRLYREGLFRSNTFWGNDRDFAGAVLICRSGGEEHRVPISQKCLTPGGKRDVMTLDCGSWTLSPGLPAWRWPLNVAVRVLLVLAAKALLFLLMQYRELRSWLSFLGVNLATQIPLSLSQRNRIWVDAATFNSSVFLGALFMGMAAILMVEILLMAVLVQEHSKNRTAVYTTVANFLGVTAFILALTLLPV